MLTLSEWIAGLPIQVRTSPATMAIEAQARSCELDVASERASAAGDDDRASDLALEAALLLCAGRLFKGGTF